jgi:hypothetical protein
MTMTRPTTEQITHKGQLLSSYLDAQFNLKDFGAVGDGVTDDMGALIAAVNAVKAAGGGTLYIPVTENGYYLRRGTAASLTGLTGPMAIVSDGATLKLQGGTQTQATSAPVFFGEAVSNVTISGLRFEVDPASMVVRYLNGDASGAINFDPFVVTGKASATEMTSFRYGIRFANGCQNITVTNCHFGTGIFYPLSFTSFGGAENRNIVIDNLTFVGINSQCIFISATEDAVVSNITSIDHQGSESDWLLYASTDFKRFAISNVVISCDSAIAHRYGGIQFANSGLEDLVMSNVSVSGLQHQAVYLGTMSRSTISGLNINNCATGLQALFVNNACVTGFVATNVSSAIVLGASGANVAGFYLSNFVIDGASGTAINCTASDMDISVSSGRIVNWSGSAGSAITFQNNSAVTRRALFSDIDFVFTSLVPTLPCINARGALTSATVRNCRAVSLFGTASSGFPQPFQASSGAFMSIAGCSTVGYGTAITISSHDVRTGIEQLPSRELPLTVNSATPSVSNSVLCVTANTSATAITNFTDGVQGQEICVRVNDANTTFDFSGTNLKGNNGVDYVATSGDVIFAKRIGTNWYCTICEA